MCDCFHLAFPNWHASATGDGRRLKAPEQDTEDDLICEEPEVLEGERPRPQGSSPVEEFPTTEKYVKQAEGDFYDSSTKSSKKGKKIGFGSLFDKRSSAKMNQTEDDGSEMIVKRVKGGCAEGLVVSGGGKDGIFIKEVKPESPASKHLSLKEGDQILSATVYFDNVSYEDALQILERAQPYRLEFCLKRKPPPTTTQEDAETMRPDVTIGEEAVGQGSTGPEMRGRRKTKKQHDRISWPKFSSLTKGRRAKFKRSHSTSEAEEQRRLEISPATSDTESPLKSPLKSPDEKDKKKMHKMKLKMKTTGRRSKSVEETSDNELSTDNMEVLGNQNIMNIAEEQSFQESVTNLVDIPHIDDADNTESVKRRNEFTFPTLPVSESLHRAELISLDNTLKTTDITVALGEEKRERSEIKVSIQGKDKSEVGPDSQLKSLSSQIRTSDPSMDNVVSSPNLISQEEVVAHQVDSDIKLINTEILEKTQWPEVTDIKLAKIDVSHDMSDVGLTTKSSTPGSAKEKKERNILETESYGFRTRGPLADIAISSHFANIPNRLEFSSSDSLTSEIKSGQGMSLAVTDTKKPSIPTPVIYQPKPNVLDTERSGKSPGSAQDIKISNLQIDTSELTQKANIDAILGDLGKVSESKFKLPKVDLSKFDHQESIIIKQGDPTKAPLLKREEIEIPGREDKRSKANVQPPRIKEPKVEKIIKISKAGQAGEFNVEYVKEAVSKFPAFKLPDRDITGVLVQREIAIMEMKTGLTPKSSPSKTSNISIEKTSKLESTIKEIKQEKDEDILLPKTELHLHDEGNITENKIDQSKTKKDHQSKPGKVLAQDDVKFKLPKREDIEIPGMEAIEQSVQQQKTKGVTGVLDTKDETVRECTDVHVTKKSNIKGHEKKSKKGKVSMPSFEIKTPDIRFPDINIELPKKATSSKIDKVKRDGEMKAEVKMTHDKTEQKHISLREHEASKQTVKLFNTEGDKMLHYEVSTGIAKTAQTQDVRMASANEGEVKITTNEPYLEKAESTSKDANIDVSPQKMKLPKLKMPSIDVSLPKVKLTKTEAKSKQEETGLTKPEIDASVEFSKDEEGVEKTDMKIEAVEDTEVEPQAEIKETDSKMKKRKISFSKFGFSKSDIKVSDADISLPTVQGSLQEGTDDVTDKHVESKTTEVKDSTDSPTKFKLPTFKLPKFGVSFTKANESKTDTQMPDVRTEETTIHVKLPKVEQTALPDKGPEIVLSVTKPDAEFSLPEEKAEIIPKVDDVSSEQKKEIKLSPEHLCSKPKFDGEVTIVGLSKPLLVVDVSLPQIDLSIAESKMDIKEPKESFTFSKDEAEQKDPTVGSTTVKFKLPSINLPKFQIKTSKIPKDMPMVDIDAEEPDVKLPEVEINMKLKDDAPLVDIKESYVTSEGPYEGHSVDIKVEDAKQKEKEGMFKLPKVDISLSEVKEPDADFSKAKTDITLVPVKPEVEMSYKPEDDSKGLDLKIKKPSFSLPKLGFSKLDATASEADPSFAKTDASKPADSMDYEESIKETKESNAEYEQAEQVLKGSPTKFKLPTIKFPNFGISLPKTTAADHDNEMPEITKDEPTTEIKLPQAVPSGDLTSSLKMESSNITITLPKPKVAVSLPDAEIDNAHCETKASELVISKPEVRMSLKDHGSVEVPAIDDSILDMDVQVMKIYTEVQLPSVTEDADIPEAKEKESETKVKKMKISFPKFGFSKSETKTPDVNTSVQKETISVPKKEVKDTEVEISASEPEAQLKSKSTTGSPSKFKLPTISLPKFDISISKRVEETSAKAGDVEKSETEATSVALPQNDLEISKDMETEDTEPTKIHFESLQGDAEIKATDTDPGSHKSRFMTTKFEISLPKLKRTESKKGALKTVDIAEKPEGTLTEMESQSVDVSGAAMETEVKMKKPKVQSIEYALPKKDIKLQEIIDEKDDASMTTDDVDVKQLDHDIKIQTTTTGGSPIKFKLPTFKLPKFGSSAKVKPHVTDPSREAQPLETEVVLTSAEISDGKIDLAVPNQDLSIDQSKLDTADISLPEIKSVPHEIDSKSMKTKKTGFSLPKFGFSKPDIKVPEIDVSLKQADTFKPEGDVEMKDSTNITVSKYEGEQKDLTIVSGPMIKLPSINISKVGGKTFKEEKAMPDVDIAVKGPETSLPDTQINISTEPLSVDVTEPHMITEGETVTADLNVEDTELEVQGGKIKLPKFGIALPRVKGFDLSTSKTGVIAEANIKVQETHKDPETLDSTDLDTKTIPELKPSEVDVSVEKPDISIPESSVDTNVDIKVSKVESDQKDSTLFGSPTKFKLPSISFPKFGVKSQKTALDIKVTNLEIEATKTITDSSQPEVKLEIHPSNIEIQDDKTKKSTDIPAVDSTGLEIKVKRPSFSFPKLGFSKPDIPTPELDTKVQKIDVSIPESHMHVPDQTVEITLPKVEIEGEQKDLTIDSSPTKFKLPTVNLPKFGVKTSKGTVNLPSEISVPEPEIKVSARQLTPTIDTEIGEKEINMHATISDNNVHLVGGKVMLPSTDADVQDISIKGKADIPVVDSKDLDMKLKKPSFSLPKLGFSKSDIKDQEPDASEPKTHMSLAKGNVPVEKQGAEMTMQDEVNEQELTSGFQTKFKMPLINFPKFEIKYPKGTADISTADVDIKEVSFPETGEIQTIDIETDMDIKTQETDIDGLGRKLKLPKFGIGIQKVKETEIEGKETKTESGLLPAKEVQQPDVTIEKTADKIEIDSKGLKGTLPKIGFSKKELKVPKADVSLPKVDIAISMETADVSQQSADIKSPETDLKDDTIIGSPTKFKLPTINFPKFGIKASKGTVDSPTTNVDIKKPEVSHPDENKILAEVPSIDIKGPSVNVKDVSIDIKGKDIDKEQQDEKFKLPKFGIALPKMKGPDSETLTGTEENISRDASIDIKEPTLPKESGEEDKEAKGAEAEESKFKLPKLGISLQKMKSPEIDIHISKAEIVQTETKEAAPVKTEKTADSSDLTSKGLNVKKKMPSFTFPKLGFSKSDRKAQDIQVSETTADMPIPEDSAKIEVKEEKDIKSPQGETEITTQFGSPTKFKLPAIKLPKFGISTPKVTVSTPKTDVDITDIKVSSVDNEVETPKVDPLDGIKVKTTATEATSVNINIEESKFKLPKFEISLPKVKGPEIEIASNDVEAPEIGITEPEIKTSAEDTSVPKVDIDLQEGASIQKTGETGLKDGKAVTGSPSKFKLPTLKMPKFGISAHKSSDVKAELTEENAENIQTGPNVKVKPIHISKDIHLEGEIKETTEQAPEAIIKKKDGDKGSPSKFKLPSIKMPKLNLSRTKSQDEDDTTTKASAPDIKTEPKDDLQGPDKSPKFTMPALGDVFKGFEVEFNVSTLEEMEAQKGKPSEKKDSEFEVKAEESTEHKDKGAQDKSKFKFKFPKLGFSQSSDESDKLVDAKVEDTEKHIEAPAYQQAEGDKEQPKTEKGGWFKFSKFSSPTKTANISEKETIQPPEEVDKTSIKDAEKESNKSDEEPEKSPMSEIVEENISPTLSLRSSEAFADISSTLTTEQIVVSQSSPTKVKVKYAEPTATLGVNEAKIKNEVVTSTARCELISMEPHQPEKVNIPFSSDASSPSVETFKQMSGEIHVITSNIQAVPDTQQAAFLTNLDAGGIHTSPLDVTLQSDSVLTVQETRVQSATHTLLERRVVQEAISDDKGTILVTHTTHVFEGDFAEPISDETASSVRRLRDTVHTEKMRFFDSVETTKEVKVTSTEISLRHMDSSTDENGGQ